MSYDLNTIGGHTCIKDDGGTPNRRCYACEREDGMGEEVSEPKVVILINKSLGMKPGKIAAQACHAMARLAPEFYGACIVLYAADADVMTAMHWKVHNHNNLLSSGIIVDAGRTEIPPGSLTAVAFLGAPDELDPITGGLELV